MHDWSFLSVDLDWASCRARLNFRSASGPAKIEVSDVRELKVPRCQPWGPSVSVNTVTGPTSNGEGLFRLQIEMQSGDQIEIIAGSIEMPPRSSV